MSFIKVSVLCFMVLLMTMSVASVAKGEANLYYGIDHNGDQFFVGDTIDGSWFIRNTGSSVVTNLEADIYCINTDLEGSHFVIGDLNPGDRKNFVFRAKAQNVGTGLECGLSIQKVGSTGSQGYDILERESVPEFPTVAIPAIAVMGLIFLLQRRKAN